PKASFDRVASTSARRAPSWSSARASMRRRWPRAGRWGCGGGVSPACRGRGAWGAVVAGLSSEKRRDFIASEARQRAALHRLPPFAVLVLDGATRRPLAGAVQAVLAPLVGREVAIVTDPPTLVFALPNLVIPDPPVDLV